MDIHLGKLGRSQGKEWEERGWGFSSSPGVQ